MKFSLLAQLEEVERELALRRRFYPIQVHKKQLRQTEADYCIARLEAVRRTLLWLQENETIIRAALMDKALS
jgi:hypothetical protein